MCRCSENVCRSKWCRGCTCGTGCAYIYLVGSQARIFALCCLLDSPFHHSLSRSSSHHPPPACRPRQGRISGPLFRVLISNHGKGWLLYCRFFCTYSSEQLSASVILELSSTFPLENGNYCLEKFFPVFPLCFRLAGDTFCWVSFRG